MIRTLRFAALALALAAAPACAALRAVAGPVENPLAAARGPDQRAYALLHAYAAAVEEAADLAADPAVPLGFKRALGQAERAATPAVETLGIAMAAYVRARAEFDAIDAADRPAIARAADALAIAAAHLNQAAQAARAPIAELEQLIAAARG